MTTWVSQHQKGKPFWILLQQEMMGGIGISWTICKSFAPRSRQITTPVPHHSVFTGRMPFLPPNQQRQSTEGCCCCCYYYYFYYYYYYLHLVTFFLGEHASAIPYMCFVCDASHCNGNSAAFNARLCFITEIGVGKTGIQRILVGVGASSFFHFFDTSGVGACTSFGHTLYRVVLQSTELAYCVPRFALLHSCES